MSPRTVALVLLLTLPVPARAWGPHTEITAAALAVVPDREKHEKTFGADWDRISRDYCWMADWQEAVRPDHYAEDYLLFPASPKHHSHMLPEARKTYEPFFRRAVQAVRTESPRNAARWMGSLLHFVQDSGSPPHTIGVGGDLHGRMERWVDESRITIKDYEPQLLGKTDDEALRGFLDRMEVLITFSKERALKLKPLLEKETKRVNQALELECALEASRVTADVVHTLLVLGSQPVKGAGGLDGKFEYQPPADYAKVPARVMLAGTDYSTTTDDGSFAFRNLPAGRYRVLVLGTGLEAEESEVEVHPGKTATVTPKVRPDAVPGNLVRNPRFTIQWLKPDQPDCWARDPVRPNRWAGAIIRVPVEQKCAVRVEFVPGKEAPVAVRWRSNPASASGPEVELDAKQTAKGVLTAEVAPDKKTQPFEKGMLFLEVLVQTERPLAEVSRHIAVTFVKPR